MDAEVEKIKIELKDSYNKMGDPAFKKELKKVVTTLDDHIANDKNWELFELHFN